MSRVARDLATSFHSLVIQSETEGDTPCVSTVSSHAMQRLIAGQVPHVAIVGAGFSGLRCADVLLRCGARVTIFEARSRVGGRVHQQSSGGYLMDMGANWLHGTSTNPMWQLAEKTGTTAMEPLERQVVVDPQGRSKTEVESNKLAAEVWGLIVKAMKYSDENSDKIDKDMSLMDYFKQELPKKFPNDPEKVQELILEARMWGPFVGESIDRQSLKFYFLEEGLDDENAFLAGTYHKVLREVSQMALKMATIKFNEEVTKIHYRSTEEDISVEVQTKDGTRHTFDEVVVTCPLGWLKRNQATTFTPQLPQRLSQAIDSIGYGKLEKLYVTFPSAFWLNNNDHSLKSQGIDKQKDFSIPVFYHFQRPLYHPWAATKDSLCWNQNVVSLAHLPPPTAHPTLLFYIYGDCGIHLTHLLASHPPHSPTYNKLLDDFAQPFYSRFPNYDPSAATCKPTSYLLTAWQLDRFAGHGSYSNFQIGLERGDEDIEVMRDAGGLSDAGRGLWLAGEHTAPFVAVGTTTGAWWSGEAVARRIAKRYDLKVDEHELSKTVEEAGKGLTESNLDVTPKSTKQAELPNGHT